MGRFKKIAIAGALALTAAVVIAPVAGANEYPGSADSKTFKNSAGGYTSSVVQSGLCLIPPLACPAVDNTWQSTGGVGLKPPDGFLRTALGSVAGVESVSSGIWESPQFKYRGFKGAVPGKILFHMRQQSDVSALLGALGGGATFQADIVRASDGVVVNSPWDPTGVVDRPSWTILPRVNIGNGGMDINSMYFIRITTTYTTGLLTVIPSARVDYDNVIIQTLA